MEAGGQTVTIEAGLPLKPALAQALPHLRQPFTAAVAGGKVGYLDVRTLSADPSAFHAFLDSAFTVFRRQNIRTLAIDLRHNSGGNTGLADILFSFISRKPYSWGLKSWRISQPYKDALLAAGDSSAAYLSHENGTVWESGNCRPEAPAPPRDSIFTGKVFVITGPFTFSSAMALADVVKTWGLGTVIGEAAGENTMDFGEAFAITLPYSGFRIQSTSSLSHGADCGRRKNGPVMPDVRIRQSYLDEVNGKDRVMEYLLQQHAR